MRSRALLALALALGMTGAGTSQALAASVLKEDVGGTIFYVADVGELNDLAVSLDGGSYTFADAGAPIDPVGDCAPGPSANVATCPANDVTDLEIRLADGDDRVVVGPATPSIVFGGTGNDDLTAGGGQDRVEGEEGDDALSGGAGDDELNGEPLRSTSTGTNNLDGGLGNDLLNGGAGADTMQGGGGGDTLFGLAGVDDLDGGDDTDDVSGGDGDDLMRGGSGNDRVGSDATLIQGVPPERGDDQLDGGLGDDVLRPGSGATEGISDNDLLGGGGGFDSVVYEKRVEPVAVFIDNAPNDGGAGESDNVAGDVERLVGSQAEDLLVGSAAADTIDGVRGADTIRGGAGADTLDGGTDDAEGDDVSGGDGDDQVRGNAGDDALAGDAGADVVEGGGGADRASGGGEADSVTGGPGVDDIDGGPGDDVLDGSATGPVGIDGADAVSGGPGNDSLEGGDGDDTMAGGTGVDTMSGEAGSDTVEYAGARRAVEVTLNDRADDGQQGERDNVRADVENVSGGGVEDTFTGSPGVNVLDGSSGEDFVDGRRGRDELDGGGSVDVVRARDGGPDVVDCGPNTDLAIVDRRDTVRRCERTDRGRGNPTAGSDVVVRPASAGAEFGVPEGSRTVPLLDRVELPVAGVVDASDGAVRLTAAAGPRARQSGRFGGSLFRVLQRRGRRPVTELRLKGGDFRRCGRPGSASAAQLGRRTIRRLRARARGRFRTRGRHSAATVRGTVFTVEDRCDGTLTRVRRGVVLVRDFRLRRTIAVRAGRSYLARAPRG